MGFFSAIGNVISAIGSVIISAFGPSTNNRNSHSSSVYHRDQQYGSSYRSSYGSSSTYRSPYSSNYSPSNWESPLYADDYHTGSTNLQTYSRSVIDSKPTSFLKFAQWNDYPLPYDILVAQRGEDELPQTISDTMR